MQSGSMRQDGRAQPGSQFVKVGMEVVVGVSGRRGSHQAGFCAHSAIASLPV